MINKLWFYLILTLVGIIILSWPEENNQMMVKFSDTHGPSKLDIIGLSIIMLGYLPMIIKVIKKLGSIYEVIGKSQCILLILISIIFLAVIPFALAYSNEGLLWVSVGISTVSQSILIYYAFSIHSKNNLLL